MVAFALLFPSISEAVRRSGGHITPLFLKRFYEARKNPKVLDLGLIGVVQDIVDYLEKITK